MTKHLELMAEAKDALLDDSIEKARDYRLIAGLLAALTASTSPVMNDQRRLEVAIGYAPITASFPGGGGGLTHMAAIDRDRIVRDVLAAGFRYSPDNEAEE